MGMILLKYLVLFQYNLILIHFTQQQSAYQPRYPFMEPLQTSVLNNSVCRRDPSYNYGDVENLNLCSTYKFDHPYMCSVSETQLRLSRDRGSPLICGNSLAGILSVILPSDQSKNLANAPDSCLNTLQTNAYYTRVSAYVNWIRNIISRYAPQQSPTGQPISIVPSSPPYEPGDSLIFNFRFYFCPIFLLFLAISRLLFMM